MHSGLFAAMASGYSLGARSLWSFLRGLPLILRPVVALWVIPASLVLKLTGLLFSVGIVFDVLAAMVDRIRGGILGWLRGTIAGMQSSRLVYVFAPVPVVVLTPLVLLAGLLPKIGMQDVVFDHDDTEVEPDGRYYGRVRRVYGELVTTALAGLAGHGWWFLPLALAPGLLIAVWGLGCTVLAFALQALDLISWLVDWLRNVATGTLHSLGRGAGSGFVGAVAAPVVMVVLAPIYLLILLIPKLSTSGPDV